MPDYGDYERGLPKWRFRYSKMAFTAEAALEAVRLTREDFWLILGFKLDPHIRYAIGALQGVAVEKEDTDFWTSWPGISRELGSVSLAVQEYIADHRTPAKEAAMYAYAALLTAGDAYHDYMGAIAGAARREASWERFWDRSNTSLERSRRAIGDDRFMDLEALWRLRDTIATNRWRAYDMPEDLARAFRTLWSIGEYEAAIDMAKAFAPKLRGRG